MILLIRRVGSSHDVFILGFYMTFAATLLIKLKEKEFFFFVRARILA